MTSAEAWQLLMSEWSSPVEDDFRRDAESDPIDDDQPPAFYQPAESGE